jgi:uncharacterized protein (TIGR04255 family)
MNEQYPNPPVAEAVCEFRFVESTGWDFRLLSKFFERISATYPGKPRQQNLLAPTLQTETLGDLSLSVRVENRTVFPNLEGNRLVAVAQNMLSVQSLKPYAGWTEYRPRIEAAIGAWSEVFGSQQVSRIGLRYINQIAVSEKVFDLDDYFTTAPQLPEGTDFGVGTFLHRTEYVLGDREKLIVTLATGISTDAASTFVVDLDAVHESKEATVLVTDALNIVEALKATVRTSFEGLITAKTRRLFGGT